MLLPLEEIRIGDRVRKDMGDLKSLAESIARHGLLHPVVVKKDRTLVAGHRRIEAARLLGLADIDVTVVDVEDLLSAERDENEERKDFTPTEAVAIGRLIEEREKPRAEARWRAGALKGGQVSAAARRGEVEGKRTSPSPKLQVRDIVAPAVGLSPSSYERAKAVVAAAEADPATYGDLPSKMDESGNIAGTHKEMQRRGGSKPTARHAVHYKAPLPKPNREVERAVVALDGICLGLKSIAVDQLDPARTKEWADAIKATALLLHRFARRLRSVKADPGQRRTA